MITENYRDILKHALGERCQRNPRYSLRAFARDLQLNPAHLSEVLNGKKGLSLNIAQAISKILGFSPEEKKVFCALVESQHARSRAGKTLAKDLLEKLKKDRDEVDPQFRILTIDAFQATSNWYHFAILQLMQLDAFQSDKRTDIKRISKALGISPIEVQLAIETLKRLEVIEERNGKLLVLENYIASTSGVPSDALKKWHRQVLEKAMNALTLQSVDERDFSSIFFPIPRKALPEITAEIKSFRRRLCRKYSPMIPKEEVYSLSIQFFKLTNTMEQK